MRAMIFAGALAAAAASANAAEPAACYDAAVTGWVTDYANDVYLDPTPHIAGRLLPRVQADALVYAHSQMAGPALPKEFWARAVLTEAPDPSPMLLIYLKTQPDGVPAVVGYRLAPIYRQPALSDYPAC
jgi:hypothetical protein